MCVCIHIHILTRKYDTLIHSLDYGGRKCDSLTIADYSSKQNNRKRGPSLSSPLSIITR